MTMRLPVIVLFALSLMPLAAQDSALACDAGLARLVQLGNTLHSWKEEIAITEGVHTKMEVLQRQAYGFRNFQNYRLRVKVLCS